MTERITDALANLPVDYPAVPEVDFDGLQVPRRQVTTLGRVVASALVAAVLVLGVVTPVRQAVADWLGIGVAHIVVVGELPPDLGVSLDLGEPVPVGSVDIARPEALGEPDGAFVREGDVSLVWLPGPDLPRVAVPDVGAILTRFDGSIDAARIEKAVGAEGAVLATSVNGRLAFWIEGAHSFGYLREDGTVIIETLRLSASALLWENDGATWRLESGLDLESAIAIAESVPDPPRARG
ncbi:MAG: hypothetical protein WEE36_06630 [Acidimicrobiia bacterium]